MALIFLKKQDFNDKCVFTFSSQHSHIHIPHKPTRKTPKVTNIIAILNIPTQTREKDYTGDQIIIPFQIQEIFPSFQEFALIMNS